MWKNKKLSLNFFLSVASVTPWWKLGLFLYEDDGDKEVEEKGHESVGKI